MRKLLIFILFVGLFSQIEAQVSGYKPGDKATDFRLMSVDGNYYSMSDYKDAVGFIVIFTCNHCPFAVKYEDRIIELAKKYKGLGYILIAINPNDPQVQPEDSYELMKVRAQEKKFNFPYLFDEGQKIYPKYGATKTPHAFLLDKNLIVKYIGAIDDNADDADSVTERYLENAIAAMEGGKTPVPGVTRAIGCSIKYKK